MEPEPQTCAGWRSFPGFFGRDNVRPIGQYEYFPILNNESYMWSYVVSGGSVYGCDYIGTSDDWAINEPKVVFTSFLGSWFGQWEKESDFLRAPLGASGYTLVSIFSGQPQWILHPMGMGETIGYAAMLTQNNNTNNGIYPPQLNAGAGQIHIDLMGDPSLRMHIVKPPGAVSATVGESGVALNWSPSLDSALGYYVYRSMTAEGPFTRISGDNAVTATSFADSSGNGGSYYMVRALKLEQTPTGSFYNLSQGVFYPDATSSSAAPETPRGLAIAAISRGSVDISWIGNFNNVRAFEIQRRTLPNGSFTKIAEAPSNASLFSDTTLSAGIYAYRVKALGFAGDSDFSGEASINFNPSWGTVVGADKTTSGNWIGKYGADGYMLVGGATNIPSYVTFNPANINFVMGKSTSDDEPETLWYPDGKHRFLAAWFNNHRAPMVFSFRFNDEKTHRVTFYMVDYKSGVRAGTLSIIDPYTGTEFGSLYFNNYKTGEYVTVDVRNYANIVVAAEYPEQYGVPINAIFFDAAPQTGAATQATFVGLDTTTQGDWKAKYGSDGRLIAGLSSSLPTDVVVNHSNQDWTWDTMSSEPRALNTYSDLGRVAAAWYSPGQCVFDVNINSAQPKQVALYLLDWDNSGRVEDIIVTDAATDAMLLTKRIDKFAGGKYVVFNAKGSIKVAAKSVSGPNAVVNGIFFGDATSTVSSDPARLSVGTIDVSSGSYIIRIAGQPGQVFDIETSSDFRSWTKVGQQTLSGTSIDFPMPFAVGNEVRCLRALLAQ
jgi:hypothetical protein